MVQNAKHKMKHSETTPTNKQIKRKRLIQKGMLTLPSQIRGTKVRRISPRKQETYTFTST